MKADFNGALIEIINAKNTQLIGLKGIVAKETQQTFIVVDKSDKQKILLKANTVFRIFLPYTNSSHEQIYVDLWGDMLIHKGS